MQLTQAEVNEKYAKVPVTFYRYWKYEFYFKGTAYDGNEIKVSNGGSADDIYRYSVTTNSIPFTSCDDWRTVEVLSPNEESLFKIEGY